MKRKSLFILLGVLLVVLGMTSCFKNEEEKNRKTTVIENQEILKKSEGEKMSKEKIQQEDLIKEYNFSEEDLAGIDICSFLNMYNTEYLNKYDLAELGMTEEEYVRDILEFYKEEFSDSAPMNYEYLLKSESEDTLLKEEILNMERLVWQKSAGEELEALAFDFENNRIYDGADLAHFDRNDLAGTTDDTIKQKVIQLITDYEIYDWKDYYKGGSMKDTTGGYSWAMAIEFSDGTIYRTGGGGSGKEARPDNMYDFITALRECESKNTPVSE